MINIKRGLNLPIAGAPLQQISDGAEVSSVGVIGFDYMGMKPTMHVQVGDKVKKGQLLFEDKKIPGVKFTAPAAGVVQEIHRGEKRVLQSVVIGKQGNEAVSFERYNERELIALDRAKVEQQLVDSGMWVAFRTRPFSRTPALGTEPHSIFITAMDSNPLAADPAVVLKESEKRQAFLDGLRVISVLTQGKLFVCKRPKADIPIPNDVQRISVEEFDGPHPAGLVGTHIHFLDPVSIKKTVWTIGYQDVVAIGKLFTEGELFNERIVAISGPQASRPRLVRAELGTNVAQLLEKEMEQGENRIISGSVFNGRTSAGPTGFLGRFHQQLSVLKEGTERQLLHYVRLGSDRHSVLNIFSGKFLNKLLPMTTSTNGSERAILPVESYEAVMPLDILPTQLLRALVVGDTDTAQKLGCLELDEEDLALCTYACPGKYEYGPILRDNLARIEKEG